MTSRKRIGMLFPMVMALSACGARVHHAEPEHANQPAPQPRDPTAEPQPDPAPGTPEQDFIVSDEPQADPTQLLEATKHDCCEEASPGEVRAGIRDQPSPTHNRSLRIHP